MNTYKHIALAAVAVVALGAAAPDRMNEPVERSIWGSYVAHWEISLADGAAWTMQTGISSHMGVVTTEGEGEFDLATGTFVSCVGSSTAANGDQVFWELTPDGLWFVSWNGGTGRFERATGGMNMTWQSEPVITIDPVGGIMTMDLTYTGEGVITY